MKIYSQQKKAIKRLFALIYPFLAVSFILLIYDVIFLVAAPRDCSSLFKGNEEDLNEVFWSIERFTNFYLWSIPIVVVFWRSLRTPRHGKSILNGKAKESRASVNLSE